MNNEGKCFKFVFYLFIYGGTAATFPNILQ